MDAGTTETRALIEGGDPLEASFIELVIGASECSDDGAEIADLVDALLDSDRVQLSEDCVAFAEYP